MKTKNYIGGRWMASDSRIVVYNPASGERIAEVSSASAADTECALESARAAFDEYSQFSIQKRQELILRLVDRLKEESNSIIELLILETGKTKEVASYDFGMLLNALPFFIEEVKRNYGETIPDYSDEHINIISHQPVGVVAGLLTWNFPLLNLAYKLGPALATGCTAVFKASHHTPLSSLKVAEVIDSVGFPEGTVNILTGDPKLISDTIAGSKFPRLLTTIGSTFAGKKLIEKSASSIKRFSLELGGDAPVIVFEDADLDNAVEIVCNLKMANAGQICVSPNRIYIHDSIYNEFIEKAAQFLKKYRYLGDEGDGPELSPLVDEESVDRLESICNSKTHRGTVVLGGKKVQRDGYFFEPTIIKDLPADTSLVCEELFGPVLPVFSFSSEEDIYAKANDTDYGLSAYVFTQDLGRALEAEKRLLFGNILINTAHYSIQLPHGGLKQSGVGKDIGHHALSDYYDLKRISIKR
jgi:acyl-CoA reductase-like NAD-dependent aldehyde dehydrogenase